jgi:hypothetical protein
MTLRSLFVLSLCVASTPASAQIVLSGTVRATDGAPLHGVGVQLVGTSIRTTTDSSGKFSLTASPEGVLAFTLAGRRPTQQQVQSRSTLDVTMELDRVWWRGVFPGTPVRVRTTPRTFEGNFVRVIGERFVVETETATDSIAIRHIEIVWKKVPAIERGARVGLAIGAVTAGLVTHLETRNARRVCLLRGALCGPDARAMYVVLSAAMGGGGGAVLGGAIGRSFATWTRVHP